MITNVVDGDSSGFVKEILTIRPIKTLIVILNSSLNSSQQLASQRTQVQRQQALALMCRYVFSMLFVFNLKFKFKPRVV